MHPGKKYNVPWAHEPADCYLYAAPVLGNTALLCRLSSDGSTAGWAFGESTECSFGAVSSEKRGTASPWGDAEHPRTCRKPLPRRNGTSETRRNGTSESRGPGQGSALGVTGSL